MTRTADPERGQPRRTVFLVDDHPLVSEWLTALINGQPDLIVCGQAEQAQAALQTIAQLQPDVAVVDLSLRDSSGIELIKNLKQTCPAVAVLVLSMHEESHYAERALRAGAKGYITKRESTRKVIGAIRQVLEGRLYVSTALAAVLAEQFVRGEPLATRSPIEQLSDRELEVFELLGRGRPTRQIAATLNLSVKTVQAYCARIKDKLALSNATELLREAVRWHESADKS
jgi:DNA-binding NarL/FixJ family response regulator